MATEIKGNPANPPEATKKRDFKRIPMSVVQQRLTVPELEGYHLHWFRDSNVPRAQQAGYERVTTEEIPINQLGVATAGNITGSQALDDSIAIVSGRSELGAPEYLVLMKLPERFWLEDRAAIDANNAARMSGIFRDEKIIDPPDAPVTGKDRDQRYVSKALMQRRRQAKTVIGQS